MKSVTKSKPVQRYKEWKLSLKNNDIYDFESLHSDQSGGRFDAKMLLRSFPLYGIRVMHFRTRAGGSVRLYARILEPLR